MTDVLTIGVRSDGVVDHNYVTPGRPGDVASAEFCRRCQRPVHVMAFKGTGFCSARCKDAP